MKGMAAKNEWTDYVWLIYLAFFIAYPALKPQATPLEWIATIVAVAVFLPIYFRGFRVGGRAEIPIIAAITLLGVIYWPFNPGAGAFFIYAAAFAARIGPGRAAVRAILLI